MFANFREVIPFAGAASMMLVGACMVSAPAAASQKLVNEGDALLDPLMQYAEQMAPRNEFFLNSSDDVELVRFKRPHDLAICVSRSTGRAVGAPARSYPISVTWDGNVGVVTPGNCLTFDAQTVKVRPATRLPENMELTGTVRVLR